MKGTEAHAVREAGPTATDRPTRHDKRMLRLMNDPRGRRMTATRAQRRGVVAAHLVLTGVFVTGMTGLVRTQEVWWSAVIFGALLFWMPATGMLNAATRGLLELRARVLDERQLAERGTVHTLAHRASFVTMLLAIAGGWLMYRPGMATGDLVVPLVVMASSVAVVHWLLPLWIAALRVPDEPADDDIVGEQA